MLQTNIEINIAILIATVILFLLGAFIISLMLLYQRKQQFNKKEKDQLQSHYEQELLKTQLEIQEQTFKTIAQEIHDNIGQMLSLAKLNLNRIDTSKLDKDEEKVKDAKELVGKSIQELRDLSKTLNTDTITSIGLLKAIETELQLLQKTDTVQTNLQVIGNPIKLDPQKELILFRITQEALHNIIKHAFASTVRVTASFHSDDFELTIIDDGKGFDSSLADVSGSGLRNMKSRAHLIGATWEIKSSHQNGTCLHVSLPLLRPEHR